LSAAINDKKINLTHTMQLEKNNSEFILYQTDDGLTKIQVRLENETAGGYILLSLSLHLKY
jgi:hypothetical protein